MSLWIEHIIAGLLVPLSLSLMHCEHGGFLQDEDFVADKDDSGSPTDDSGGEDSDANDSGDENEVNHCFHSCCSDMLKLSFGNNAISKLVIHVMTCVFRNLLKRNRRKNPLLLRHPPVG